MKKWKIGNPDPKMVASLQNASDLSELCCMVLASRGYINIEQAAAFMGCRKLSDPLLITDMQESADSINQAIDEGKRICIYGDYDCDGVMSTVILYSFLHEIGADVLWRIPERSEGYGLNQNAVREMHEQGVELIVTVDNGISAIEEAKLIQELGMELVITDHHQPSEELPQALAIVDAHRTDNYSPFRLYCGAGIALLLVAAMHESDTQMALEQFGDLAAIATIADVVALTGENRYLVQMGLEYLENTERVGLLALKEVCGLAGRTLSAVNVAFTIAPRMNAAGRLASPKLAVELLLEENPDRAKELAAQLNQINLQRKEKENEIMQVIQAQILENPSVLHERVLLFAGQDWHTGVIGIVASRLQERYGKPCFMISISNGYGHGSARSFGDFHIFKALTSCSEVLERFGGHPSAGGFTLKEEQIPAFREKIAAYARQQHPDMPFMEVQVVCALTNAYLKPEAVRSLNQLAPFGADNPEPVFLAEHVLVQDIRPTANGSHTRMTVSMHNQSYTAMLFGKKPEQTGVSAGKYYHMLTKLNVSEYNHQVTVTLYIQDIRPVGMQQMKILNAMQIYDKYCRKEMLPKAYYQAMYPSREELIRIYQAISEKPVTAEELAAPMAAQNINYCKLLLALDVFTEMELISVRYDTGEIIKFPVRQKVNLENSSILEELKKYI